MKFKLQLLFLIGVLGISSCKDSKPTDQKSGIKEADWCSLEMHKDQKVVFSSTASNLSSWNHITDSLQMGYGLKGVNFDVDSSNWSKSCQGLRSSFEVNLVKKIGDWNQQHLNGMEMFYGDSLIKYSSISSIQLFLKIDGEETVLPKMDEVAQIFDGIVTADQIGAIETSKFNLGITLFESGGTVSDKGDFNAFHILEIDPVHFDKWIEVNIPLGDFKYYLEKNYNETFVKPGEFPSAKIKGIRLCAETHTGQVIRNLNSEFYESNTPEELCKELSFSIGAIAFNYK
ncbi:MAG: hypothetical protein NXI20_22450 [bacterium]|nr:hypothetical protein [bacterium]